MCSEIYLNDCGSRTVRSHSQILSITVATVFAFGAALISNPCLPWVRALRRRPSYWRPRWRSVGSLAWWSLSAWHLYPFCLFSPGEWTLFLHHIQFLAFRWICNVAGGNVILIIPWKVYFPFTTGTSVGPKTFIRLALHVDPTLVILLSVGQW